MDIVWGNANAEVTSAPPPAATNALREGVVTQETLPEMPQVPVSGPAVPDPPAEVPAQRLQGDAQETATQAPAEGVSEEGEIAAEVPKKQSSKARWKNKKGKDEHRNAILFCQGKESEKGFFVWTDIELEREKMPGHEGKQGHALIRHRAMEDSESSPFVMVPTALFKRREHGSGGYLSTNAFAFSKEDDYFEAIFLPPFRENVVNHHSYTVEAARQRAAFKTGYKLDRGKGILRGCLTENKAFSQWALHISRVHEETLRRAGIYDAILCTTQRLKKDMKILAAFLQFWSL